MKTPPPDVLAVATAFACAAVLLVGRRAFLYFKPIFASARARYDQMQAEAREDEEKDRQMKLSSIAWLVCAVLLIGGHLSAAPRFKAPVPKRAGWVKTPGHYKKDRILLHMTQSTWGDVAAVNKWHVARGWSGIGYHRLITNYYPTYNDFKFRRHRRNFDGRVFLGRQSDSSRGAHCYQQGMNERSIGVCLVGKFDQARPTARQFQSMIETCVTLCIRYGIQSKEIYFHRDYAVKSCPGKYFPSRASIRKAVAAGIVRRRLLQQ